MPYVTKLDRILVDTDLDRLIAVMPRCPEDDVCPAGIINYVITRIVAQTSRPCRGWSYASLSKALAIFRDAEAEMRRRLLDPYEDKAISKNGDIPEYGPAYQPEWIAYILYFEERWNKEAYYWVSFYPPSDENPKACRFTTEQDALDYALKYTTETRIHKNYNDHESPR